MSDNVTPMSAAVYDEQIAKTIPFYTEFHKQVLEIAKIFFEGKIKWLDTGCGTGTLALKAAKVFPEVQFTLMDPSEKMLEQCRKNTAYLSAQYEKKSSQEIACSQQFDIVTAIMCHHYLKAEEREEATRKIYEALKPGGIYMTYENCLPESEALKKIELKRWGVFQMQHGKTKEEAAAHLQRCGSSYFPITMAQHQELLKKTGFKEVHIFWTSYMQLGIYGIK